MKKRFLFLSVLLSVIVLVTGVYWFVNILLQAEANAPISAPAPICSEFPGESALFTSMDLPPATITWESSFEGLVFREIRKEWHVRINEIDLVPVLQESIRSDGKNTIYSSLERIAFSVDYEAYTAHVSVHDSRGNLVYAGLLESAELPMMEIQDLYTYTVEIRWDGEGIPFAGTYVYTFDLFLELPVRFEFDQLTVVQGEFVTVTVYNVNEGQIPVLNQNIFRRFRFYQEGHRFIGYLPAGYFTRAGVYTLHYGIQGEPLEQVTLTIQAYNFRVQHLFISEQIAARTRNEASSAEYNKYYVPSRLQSHPERYYTEPFVIPAFGRLSTEFGQIRHVNNSPTSSRHSGLDISNVIGTPIFAVNRGRVVLSMYLIMTGHTIVIDHGQGLFSTYFHMDSRISEQGEMVERGQQIGYMGTTGFSTGSHLHLTMSIYDTNIEPGYLLVGEPITRENYRKHLVPNP